MRMVNGRWLLKVSQVDLIRCQVYLIVCVLIRSKVDLTGRRRRRRRRRDIFYIEVEV
jgi:hypothetical protein